MVRVMDAGPMIAYLQSEPGGDVVQAMLADADTICYAHVVNLCEVYYHFLKNFDEAAAELALSTLFADGIILRRDISQGFWKRVGLLKARGRISLADCFCIALSQITGGEVVTTDHDEFDPLVPLGICPIRFIR